MCTMDMSRMYSSIMRDKKIKKNAFYNENYVKNGKNLYELFD